MRVKRARPRNPSVDLRGLGKEKGLIEDLDQPCYFSPLP
jgi:hypothetical protein